MCSRFRLSPGRRLRALVLTLLSAAIGYSACNPPLTPAAPATEPPNPTPRPYDLSGLQTGDAMRWFDYNTLVYHGNPETPDERFWIYRYNVTNDMYRRCVQAGVCSPPGEDPEAPSYMAPELKDHPVVNVTFDQAQSYCGWMDLRLPTSAEWETAAGLTEGNMYPWGDEEPSCILANIDGCVGAPSGVMDRADGQSPSTVFDMAGNVRNWTNDRSVADSPDQPEEGEFLYARYMDSADYPNIRGSSFKDSPDSLVVIAANAPDPSNSDDGIDGHHADDLGFRCALAAKVFQDTQAPQEVPQPDLLGFTRFCQLPILVGQPPERPACAWPQIVESSTYCHDMDDRVGAVNVFFEEQGDEITSFWPAAAEGPNDFCVWSSVDFSQNPGTDTVTCVGPQLSDVTVKVCIECTVELEYSESPCLPDPFGNGCEPLPDYQPRCPEGWIEDDAGECRQVVLPPSETDRCPAGYDMDPSSGCCDLPSARAHCWPGFSYDSERGMCISDPGLYPPVVECQLYEFELGFCTDKESKGTDGCSVQCKPPKTLDAGSCTCQ